MLWSYLSTDSIKKKLNEPTGKNINNIFDYEKSRKTLLAYNFSLISESLDNSQEIWNDLHRESFKIRV